MATSSFGGVSGTARLAFTVFDAAARRHALSAGAEADAGFLGQATLRLAARDDVWDGRRVTLALDVAALATFDPGTGAPLCRKGAGQRVKVMPKAGSPKPAPYRAPQGAVTVVFRRPALSASICGSLMRLTRRPVADPSKHPGYDAKKCWLAAAEGRLVCYERQGAAGAAAVAGPPWEALALCGAGGVAEGDNVRAAVEYVRPEDDAKVGKNCFRAREPFHKGREWMLRLCEGKRGRAYDEWDGDCAQAERLEEWLEKLGECARATAAPTAWWHAEWSDEHARAYWFNSLTNESVWEEPTVGSGEPRRLPQFGGPADGGPGLAMHDCIEPY